MKHAILFVPVLVLVLAATVFGGQLQAPGGENTPALGQPAPDFERPVGFRGPETLGLKDFNGRSKVLIAFYIADFTGGWTREFTEFGANYDQFLDLGIEIVGISRDLWASQQEFKTQTGARNHFLSDPNLEVTARYGAVSEGSNVRVANRYYFLIDEEGTLIWKNTTGQLIPVEALLTQMTELVGDD